MSNILTNNINTRSGNTITIGKAGDLVSIAGSLSYEDVTSVDSVGVITARSGVIANGSEIGFQYEGTNNPFLGIRYNEGVDGSVLFLQHSRSNTVGTAASLSSGDEVGAIEFRSYRANNTNINVNAQIKAIQTGDASNNGITPTDLTFSTAASERLRIDSSGKVGIGTTSPSEKLHVDSGSDLNTAVFQASSASSAELQLIAGSDVTDRIRLRSDTSNNFIIFNGDSESMRIDSSGRLLVGTTSSSAKTTSVFEGNSTVGTGDARLILALGDNAPANDTLLGILRFTDTSHSTANTSAADITVARDGGTWTSGTSMPGRLVFSTTADGASSPTERMRIDSAGNTFFEGRFCTNTTSGNTGDTRTLTLNNIDEGAAYLVTLTLSPSLSSVSIYQTLIRYDGNGDFEGQDDIVNTSPGNMTITYNNATGGTATITYVNGGTQRFRVTALRVN